MSASGGGDEMDEGRDFLDEIIQEGSARDSDFPRLLAAAERTRALMRQLALLRAGSGISQAEVARRMKTSQPAVARLEAGESDPRLSTVERYAGVIGQRLTTTVGMNSSSIRSDRSGQITVRLRLNESVEISLGDTVGPAVHPAEQPRMNVGQPNTSPLPS